MPEAFLIFKFVGEKLPLSRELLSRRTSSKNVCKSQVQLLCSCIKKKNIAQRNTYWLLVISRASLCEVGVTQPRYHGQRTVSMPLVSSKAI